LCGANASGQWPVRPASPGDAHDSCRKAGCGAGPTGPGRDPGGRRIRWTCATNTAASCRKKKKTGQFQHVGFGSGTCAPRSPCPIHLATQPQSSRARQCRRRPPAPPAHRGTGNQALVACWRSNGHRGRHKSVPLFLSAARLLRSDGVLRIARTAAPLRAGATRTVASDIAGPQQPGMTLRRELAPAASKNAVPALVRAEAVRWPKPVRTTPYPTGKILCPSFRGAGQAPGHRGHRRGGRPPRGQHVRDSAPTAVRAWLVVQALVDFTVGLDSVCLPENRHSFAVDQYPRCHSPGPRVVSRPPRGKRADGGPGAVGNRLGACDRAANRTSRFHRGLSAASRAPRRSYPDGRRWALTNKRWADPLGGRRYFAPDSARPRPAVR